MKITQSCTILVIIIFCITITSTAVYADDHSEEEVLKLIKKIETMLDSSKEEGAENYAGKEVSKIEQFIKYSKTQLEDGEEDFAFYEIKKAEAYFKLIEAKKELMNAENDLKNARAMK